jgi:hypothetical protein
MWAANSLALATYTETSFFQRTSRDLGRTVREKLEKRIDELSPLCAHAGGGFRSFAAAQSDRGSRRGQLHRSSPLRGAADGRTSAKRADGGTDM